MDQTKDNSPEIMVVELLFKSKPQTPTTEQFRKALQKHFGDLGDSPYAEPSEASAGDMFMFPIPKYKVFFKDRPEGVPVIATFLSSARGTGVDIDDMTRRQFWDIPNANEIIDECRHTILVNTALGRVLPYKDQAEILLAQVDAALECYPECVGIFAPQSGKLITPEMFRNGKEYSLSSRFVQLFVNARFFNIPDADEMLVDTLGFYVFGGADVQVHFKELNPNHVVKYVYNVAIYQFDNDFPIKSSETIYSIDEEGNMQNNPQWTVQYENSLVDPMRTVLDICCGEYAGGSR